MSDDTNRSEEMELELITVNVGGKNELVDPNTTKFDMLVRDLEIIQKNAESVSETQTDAINQVADLAEAAQNPKVYEALATLTKSFNDTQRTLMNVVEMKKSIYEREGKKDNPVDDKPGDGAKVINNNLFMTPKDLLKKVKEAAKDDIDDSDD